MIVGIGEAAHGSRDFVTFRHRALRYLVEKKGFRALALEANWSTGMRLDDYLRTGRGDPVRIMSEEFQNAHLLLHSQDYLDMIRWMRAYDIAHPGDPLRFVGNDNGYATPELYDRSSSTSGGPTPACCRRSPSCTGDCAPRSRGRVGARRHGRAPGRSPGPGRAHRPRASSRCSAPTRPQARADTAGTRTGTADGRVGRAGNRTPDLHGPPAPRPRATPRRAPRHAATGPAPRPDRTRVSRWPPTRTATGAPRG